ncbi:ubiquitin carboxyl-terminal hydrolase 9-like isoform X1 [Nymphaea colorata]|nr:ubiquitin carboxyl-terminal hydrolase 9-like isoform X1 [Nymphaea colorata]XP_031494375.1 ubiquitin carboxyl-terminal hydrolase 9-like isoform X1 [Nymphaea colorata]
MTVLDADCVMQDIIDAVPCSPEDEKSIVKELWDAAELNEKAGDAYYVVSSRWWRSWKAYVEPEEGCVSADPNSTLVQGSRESISKGCRPGRIDNADLVLDGTDGSVGLQLRTGLQEVDDYELVPEQVWNRLLEWYGGGPSFSRMLISQGLSTKDLVVEVYPLCLQLVVAHTGDVSVVQISRKGTVGQLYDQVSELLKLDPEKMRIWDYFNKNKNVLLTTQNQTLEDYQLLTDQDILVEVEIDGAWPSDIVKSNYGMGSSNNELALVPVEPSRSSFSIAGGPSVCNGHSTEFVSGSLNGSMNLVERDSEAGYDGLSTGGYSGLTGLQNLGNTCFMNSALQCLVHTPPLVEFFLRDYGNEINKENPLGMNGELALAFGELLRKLWSSCQTPIAPRAFKARLAHFAPQFSGYNQHDSQELLAFLLDGLHEDLNRVKLKPYIESKEPNGRPDEEVAAEYWANHKARNDSIIVDFCQGQYKSTLVCPVCSKVSVTFDPFMYLSLPLPAIATRSMTVTVFCGDGSEPPMPFTVNVQKQGHCRNLTQELSIACCLGADECLLLVEVYNHRIYRYLDNPYEPLSAIKDDDRIVAYRLPSKHEKLLRLELLHQRSDVYFDIHKSQWKPFGTPLITCLPEGAHTVADIQEAVRTVIAPLCRKKSFPSPDGIKASKDDSPRDGENDFLMENYDSDMGAENCSTSSGNGKSSFQLLLIDDRGLNKSLDCDALVILNTSTRIQITVRWSDQNEDLYDTSLLENLPDVSKSGFVMKKIWQEGVTLFSCLDTFLKEEPLSPDDMWYCPSCKEHRQATKKLDLWRLPEILVVHLKRFSYSRYFKNKLDTFVNFPVCNLDLTKYVKRKGMPESYMYELYAVSNHYGGMGGGHYTAYVKLDEGNKWYSFDDSHVSPASTDEVRTSAAYVLFYRRLREDAVAGESQEQNSTERPK